MRSLVIPAISIALVGSVFADRAAAGGLEYAGAGSSALGRGGAVVARADDPMVLANNPAGLAELRGNQLMLNINFAFMSACVDPIGYYGWGAYNGGSPIRIPNPAGGDPFTLPLGTANAETDAFYKNQLDTVCMKQNVTPVPEFGFTIRASERLGIGIGLMFPAAQPQGSWGDPQTGVIQGAAGLRPSPTRYMMINSGTIGLFPTAGFGFRVTDWLRIGAAFEWGIINVDNLSMAVVSSGTNPAQDIIAHVSATDWFIPAVNASIHLVPFDALDIVGMFRWQDALNAPGHIDLKTGVFDPRLVPHTKRNVVDGVQQNLPSKLTGAIRYADRLAPRPTGSGQGDATDPKAGGVNDAFKNEKWDLELDVEYLLSGKNKELRVDYQENQSIETETVAGVLTTARFPDVARAGQTNTDTIQPKHWKNQLSVRAGSSINLIPGFFGINLGAHYESRGVDPDYMQIDYWPVSRIGLHAGVRFRVAGRIDITASYAHIFDETIVTGAPADEPIETSFPRFQSTGEVTTIDKRTGVMVGRGMPPPSLPEVNPNVKRDGTARYTQYVTKVSGQTPWIINSGTYRSNINVFAAGVNVHF